MRVSTGDDEFLVDDEAGPLIRAYTVNGGRIRPTVDLDLLSLVVDTGQGTSGLELEHIKVLELCNSPISIAEVAARMRLPVMVTKVLLADLVDCGALTARAPRPSSIAPDRALLEKLLDGLQRV